MAIRSALPEFSKLQPNGEPWPDYVYQPFPRYVGLDAEGNALIADTEEEARRLKEIAVFPQNMGSDKDGKPVIAQGPRDLIFFKDRVVTPPEDPAVVAKREADRIAAEEEVKRKAAEYDKMMAAQKQPAKADSASTTDVIDVSADAQQPPTGLKKSKAA